MKLFSYAGNTVWWCFSWLKGDERLRSRLHRSSLQLAQAAEQAAKLQEEARASLEKVQAAHIVELEQERCKRRQLQRDMESNYAKLKQHLEAKELECELLAELNENLRRWLLANTASALSVARQLGFAEPLREELKVGKDEVPLSGNGRVGIR